MLTITASALDPQTKRINSIKIDTTYIYADVTMPTVEQAMLLAYSQLQRDVEKWTSRTGEKHPDDIKSMADTITARRDDQFRFFVYLKKEQLQSKPLVPQEEDVLERLKKARYIFELKDIMESFKQRGEILDYGKYSTIKQPEQCYLIIHDEAGNILALLGPGTIERQNLLTNKPEPDSLRNYRGNGAIWFILASKK